MEANWISKRVQHLHGKTSRNEQTQQTKCSERWFFISTKLEVDSRGWLLPNMIIPPAISKHWKCRLYCFQGKLSHTFWLKQWWVPDFFSLTSGSTAPDVVHAQKSLNIEQLYGGLCNCPPVCGCLLPPDHYYTFLYRYFLQRVAAKKKLK